MSLEKIAHRGYSAIAPENTYSAFEAALQHHAEGIEFDVQLSSDRLAIIIHDRTLRRTTNGKGKVRKKTIKELQELDAGKWFDKEFKGEKIPLLTETLDYLIPTGIKIYVEIKETKYWQKEDINNLINLILEKNGLDQCTIISFDAEFLQEIRVRNLNIKLGYLCLNMKEYQEKLSYVNAENDVILCQYKILLKKKEIIRENKQKGIKVIAWTVDNPKHLKQLLEIGLETVITNSLLT